MLSTSTTAAAAAASIATGAMSIVHAIFIWIFKHEVINTKQTIAAILKIHSFHRIQHTAIAKNKNDYNVLHIQGPSETTPLSLIRIPTQTGRTNRSLSTQMCSFGCQVCWQQLRVNYHRILQLFHCFNPRDLATHCPPHPEAILLSSVIWSCIILDAFSETLASTWQKKFQFIKCNRRHLFIKNNFQKLSHRFARSFLFCHKSCLAHMVAWKDNYYFWYKAPRMVRFF